VGRQSSADPLVLFIVPTRPAVLARLSPGIMHCVQREPGAVGWSPEKNPVPVPLPLTTSPLPVAADDCGPMVEPFDLLFVLWSMVACANAARAERSHRHEALIAPRSGWSGAAEVVGRPKSANFASVGEHVPATPSPRRPGGGGRSLAAKIASQCREGPGAVPVLSPIST